MESLLFQLLKLYVKQGENLNIDKTLVNGLNEIGLNFQSKSQLP